MPKTVDELLDKKEEPSENSDVDCFDLARDEYHFALKDKGEKNHYVIVEMDGLERDSYISNLSKRMKFDANNKPIQMMSEGLQAELLGRCLYEEDKHQNRGKRVDKKVMLAWRGSLLQKLFDKAQDINALTADAEDKAKNA